MPFRTLTILLALLLVLAPEGAMAQGCAMCKAVVESDQGILGGAQAIGKGLNPGILYLMAVPYLLLFLLFRKKIVGFLREITDTPG
jgi:hypothetical protein